MSTSVHPHQHHRDRHDRPAHAGRARNWADFLAILTGVALVASSIWPSGVTAGEEATREMGNLDAAYLTRILVGVLAVGAVVVAQGWRRRGVARVILFGLAVALVAVMAAFGDFGPRSIATMLVPAVLLAIAAVGLGPVHLEERERQPRGS